MPLEITQNRLPNLSHFLSYSASQAYLPLSCGLPPPASWQFGWMKVASSAHLLWLRNLPSLILHQYGYHGHQLLTSTNYNQSLHVESSCYFLYAGGYYLFCKFYHLSSDVIIINYQEAQLLVWYTFTEGDKHLESNFGQFVFALASEAVTFTVGGLVSLCAYKLGE